MKKLLIALSALVSLSVMAADLKVGDTSTLTGIAKDTAGTKYNLSIQQTLTAYDAATNMFNVRSVLTLNGSKQTTDKATAVDDLITEEQSGAIVGQCAEAGGKAEDVKMGRETIKTCHLQAQQEIWVAKIPFGLARIKGAVSELATAADFAILAGIANIDLTVSAYARGR